jgi:1-phosphofructokinase family hexose kinase
VTTRRRVIAVSTNAALDRVLVAPGARGGGVVHATHAFETAGGKAAQAARIAAALGADVLLVAALGGARGARYRQLLDEQGMSSSVVEVEGETRQTISIVDDGDVVEIHEPWQGLSAQEADELVRTAEAELGGEAVVIVSGSLPPGAPVDLHARLVRAARERGAFTVLDTSTPQAFAAAARERPDLVKPNLHEATRIEGVETLAASDLTEAAQLARRLAERVGCSVWLTLGAYGSLLISEQRCLRLSVDPRGSVRNAIGAGDALVGGLAAGLCRGLSLVDAASLGVAAAADAVTRDASAVIDRPTVDEICAVVHVQPFEGVKGATA